MPLATPRITIQCLRQLNRYSRQHIRYYSAPEAPVILTTNIPAPHCGRIRIVSLNRPAARNAISKSLLAGLKKEVEDIHAEGEKGPTRVLILASESDGSFCAGADLKERRGFSPEE